MFETKLAKPFSEFFFLHALNANGESSVLNIQDSPPQG